MLKTGIVGTLPAPEFEVISQHPGFLLKGNYYPDINKDSIRYASNGKLPELSVSTMLEDCEVLIFPRALPETLDILFDALRKSRHIMIMDYRGLNSDSIAQLIKLQEEAQTIVQARLTERSGPGFKAVLPLITHPCLFETRLFFDGTGKPENALEVGDALFRMLDAILFLCPLNIQKIQALRHNSCSSTASLLSSRIEFDNGSVANLLSTDVSVDESFSIEIYQKCRLLKLDLSKNNLIIIEKNKADNIINTSNMEFTNTGSLEFNKDLDNFHKSIISNDSSGKELFDIFRISELTRKIIIKAGFPE